MTIVVLETFLNEEKFGRRGKNSPSVKMHMACTIFNMKLIEGFVFN